jgi:MerR family transcriptional regulator, copper efflux regulator
MGELLIGELAERAGVSTPTIRYYESVGLLESPARTASGYRRYSAGAVDTVRFIKKAQSLGFSLDEIGEILTLSRSGQVPCSHVVSLGRQHLAAVDERIRQLTAFRDQFASELTRWDSQTKDASACGALCQLIAEAPDVTEVPLHLWRSSRETRSRGER